MLPRLIRFRDAPAYLGMDRKRFNKEVRPHLTIVPLGAQGIAFDRLEMDAWVDDYISCNGRPAKEDRLWDAKRPQGFSGEVMSGTLINKSPDIAFEKALGHIYSPKQKSI